MTYRVVIPAAGQGQRMGAGKNKLFLPLKQIPIIAHTLQVFESDDMCDGIILAINKVDSVTFGELLKEYGITKVREIVLGGESRQSSVYQGLKALASEKDGIVLIHDGARPFLNKADIHAVAKAAEAHGAAVLGVPVKDTIKKVRHDEVVETMERSSLWAIQTPQAFVLSQIIKAHEANCGHEATDDAALIEADGGTVHIVKGDYKNIKVTTPDDLIIGEGILANMMGGSKL